MIREAEKKDSIYLLVSAMNAVFEESGKMILGDGIESEHLKEMADLLFMHYLQGSYLCELMTGELAKDFTKLHDSCSDCLKLYRKYLLGQFYCNLFRL